MFLFTCLFVLFFGLLSRCVLVNITHTDYCKLINFCSNLLTDGLDNTYVFYVTCYGVQSVNLAKSIRYNYICLVFVVI